MNTSSNVTTVTLTFTDGTTQTFVPQVETPTTPIPQITVPVNTPIELVPQA